MFKKKEKDFGKLIEKDLGFISDAFGMLCDMVAFEDHSDGDYLSTGKEESLLEKDWMRKLRTKHLDVLSKNVTGNSWCKLKHLARVSKGLQELGVRYLSVGNIKSAKDCAKDWGECYEKFLDLLGADKLNDDVISSA